MQNPQHAPDIAPGARASTKWVLPRWCRDFELGLGWVLLLLSVVLPGLSGSSYWLHVFLLLNLYVVVAVSQNLLLHDAGQVSFGQGAVFGLAAYTVGIVSGMNGQPLWLGLLIGIVAGTVLGSLYALPALRVKGFYLGFVTISAAVVMPEMLIAFNDFTNGINGIALYVAGVNKPVMFGLTPLSLVILVLSLTALTIHRWIRETRIGRRMQIAAASPEAALTLGYKPGTMRFIAFVLAGIGSAVAGVLYAPLLGFLSPDAFTFELSIFFFFAVIVGGSGRLIGPLVGVAILYLVPNVLLVDLVNYRLIGYGLVALSIMLICPDGVVGSLASLLRRYRKRQVHAAVEIAPLLRESDTRPSESEANAVVVRGLRKSFGKVEAVGGVDLVVREGSIHGLVGPNGSGKTTALNLLSGLTAPDAGMIEMFGADVTNLSADRIARRGVGRTFQTPRIFESMSVWTNMQIGIDHGSGSVPQTGGNGGALSLEALEARRERWEEETPDVLPHAQRRILEVLRVVARRPRLLLLDEPAAGLSPEERGQFAELLTRLRDGFGYTIILVEHDLKLVWKVADHITVLDAGHIVDDGTPDRIMDNPSVRALFTGETDA